MEIISLLKAERDKAAQQANALDTAIRALSGMNSTGATRGRRTMSAAATSKNFGISKSTLGTHTGPEGCFNRPQAPHLTSGTGADQSGSTDTVGEGQAAEKVVLAARH